MCPALTAGWDRHTSSPQSSGVCIQVRSPNQAGSACDAPSHHLLPAPLPKLQSPGACLTAAPSWQGSLPASRHPQLCVRPAPHCSRHAHHGVLPGASTKPSHHRGFGEPASGSGKEGRGGGPRDSVGPTGRSLQPGTAGRAGSCRPAPRRPLLYVPVPSRGCAGVLGHVPQQGPQ